MWAPRPVCDTLNTFRPFRDSRDPSRNPRSAVRLDAPYDFGLNVKDFPTVPFAEIFYPF